MKKIFKQLLVTMTAIAVATSSIFVGGTTNVAYAVEEAGVTGNTVTKHIDLSDISNWTLGQAWNVNGIQINKNEARIRLTNDLRVNAGDIIVFNTANSGFKFVVRAVNDSDNVLVKTFGSVNNNDSITVPEGCNVLRLSVYNEKDSTIGSEDYRRMFAEGNLAPYIIHITTVEEDSNSLMINNVSAWTLGEAWNVNGVVINKNSARIRLTEDLAVNAGDKLTFDTGNSDYKFIIRAINSKTNVLVKNIGAVVNGTTVTVPAGCDVFRLSIYRYVDDYAVNAAVYQRAFEDGTLVPTITFGEGATAPVVTVVGTSIPTATPTSTPKPTATSTPKPTATSTPKPTATSTPKPTVTSAPKPATVDYSKISTLSGVLLAMLENGEMGTVDISRFRATATTINSAWNTVINGAGLVAYSSAKDIYLSGSSSKSKYTSISITGMDEDFVSRYELVKKTVAEGLARIQPGMSDLDKALILHEFIVDIASYNLNTDGSYKGWGILAYKQGGCMSYTASYNLLLKLAGIECKEYRSGSMSHRWSVVKLDGQWYQVDVTWDDTRLSRTGKHYYFLRTDNEFQNVLSSSHYSYGPAFSTDTAVECNSTRFVDWFVHDVKGTIVYNDGFWYFADGNNLMKARVDGSAMQVVATETAAVTVVKAENGLVTYKAGSTLKTTK